MTDSAQAVRPTRSRAHLARDIALALVLAAAGPAAVKLAPIVAHRAAAADHDAPRNQGAAPVQAALRHLLGPPEASDIAAAYAARDYRPIWFSEGAGGSSARDLLAMLAGADRDGLDPRRYRAPELRARVQGLRGQPLAEAARTEIALSRAYAAYAVDLHTPPPDARMIVTDPAAAGSPANARDALASLARAPSVPALLRQVTRVNPVYATYRSALAKWRANHPSALGDATAGLLRVNMERARDLPADPGPRWILVDVAAQELRLYENDRPVGAMRVVVGRPDLQTPIMSGVIRYAVLNPYWNVPPDLTRSRFAPRAIADPKTVEGEHMEVLTDWRPGATVLDPSTIDWSAVARGEQTVWLRQKPGPDNMMGRVKFMLPNQLGIYLHDTPLKGLFKAAERTRSAGCVRVEDPQRLAAWLFGGKAPQPAGTEPEQRVDLPAPVPVYMAYLTVMPGQDGAITFHKDVYGRDPAALAQLSSRT